MRLIIEDTQENAGRWAARYIVACVFLRVFDNQSHRLNG